MAQDASSASTTATTTTHDRADARFYPAFCFPASPTHFSWVKLSIADVHRLRPRAGFEGQNVYFYNNHPVQFVCLAGVIVTRDEYERRTILILDDSSGASIEVVILKASQPGGPLCGAEDSGDASGDGENKHDGTPAVTDTKSATTAAAAAAALTNVTATTRSPIDAAPMRVGTVVKIKGTLSMFRGTIQVVLERYWLLHETNAEVKFWNERARFLVDVLSVPWSLTPETVAALRQRAHDEEADVLRARRRAVEKQSRLEEREKKDYRRVMKRWDKEEKLRQKEAEWIREHNKRLEDKLARRKR